MKIMLFNTMGRKKQIFKPIKKGEVKLYACGPTCYSYAHIGHFRAYVFVDTLRRVLEFNGYKVRHVMNITDVGHLTSDADTGEDKIEKAARKERKTAWEIAEFYTKDFFDAMSKLNVKRPTIVCKATEHIKEMAELVQRIADNGYAYIISDGIYFDTSKLEDYGKLAGLSIEGLKAGARVEFNPEKRNITDFALWKFSPTDKKRQMEWVNEFRFTLSEDEFEKVKRMLDKNPNVELKAKQAGKMFKVLLNVRGFPGWHIECTAMSMKYLGEVFDIHTGGVDHIPVHHTNEIAQAKAATGKEFVHYWLHNEFVLVEGEKMSKSKGNIFNMKDVEARGFDPLALRYLFLTSHYRSKLNFTWKSLESAQKALSTLREHVRLLQEKDGKRSKKERIEFYDKRFLELVNDDLDTPDALALVWKLLRNEEEISNREKYKLLMKFDKVLGLRLKDVKKGEEKIPEEAMKLIEEREEARKKKDWEKADEIRERLRKMGIILEDTKEGVRWRLTDNRTFNEKHPKN